MDTELSAFEALGETQDNSDHTRNLLDSRKKQRTEDKKRFECTFAGCGRNYSRAEHLYRHQLNHNPKEIFRCNYPGCTRTFVRQDLCIRHQERHINRGKQEADSTARNTSVLSPSLSPDPGDFRSASAVDFAASQSAANAEQIDLEMPPQLTSSDNRGLFTSKPALRNSVGQYESSSLQQSASPGVNASNSTTPSFKGAGTLPSTPNPRSALRTSFSNQHITVASSNALPRQDTGVNGTGRRLTGDSLGGPFAVPSFGDQAFSDSPASVRDEFTNWLFEDFMSMSHSHFPMAAQGATGFTHTSDSFGNQIFSNYFTDPALDDSFPSLLQQQRYSEPEAPPADLPVASNLLSPSKRQSLLALIEFRFSEGENTAIGSFKDELFQGDRESDDHLLSMRSMQHYIGSYWYHFHAQLPLLHQPTFSAEDTHNYLLLAVMAIGASYLNRAHGHSITEGASKLATFIAWHLRWQVFMDADFRPPAKLWVFQTLLLLEVYEKMNATRGLHERAHIHYPTTIMLMRRGTALIDSPQNESTRTTTSPEHWWSRWITAEATRRAAFAALFIDALHATMFGHAAMMVVHEVRLPLPCDDALWSATSAAEVGRVEASLHANGVKPTLFLDGLKKTLTGRKVRTNTFGRIILMAGLLSVSWHMHQRDLQISSLGVSHAMGVPGGWKEPLTKASDFWKKDFDESLAHMRRAALPWQTSDPAVQDGDPSIMASVLHHFSHLAMHIDIMDCQIFAGAKLVFGRGVTDTDYERVKSKMHGWIKTPGSRMAVFHALQILKEVFLPTSDRTALVYNARDDYIFFRPWAMYFSGLVVWSWGYAIDGVLRPFPSHLLESSSPEVTSITSPNFDLNQDSNLKDAQSFLRTIGAVRNPQELETIKTGRNNVVGLLRTLEFAFCDSRWELLHEAAGRLKAAVKLLER